MALAIGLWYGQVLLWLVILFGGLLLWMVFHLYQTSNWLETRRAETPDADGVWGELIAHIARIKRSKRKYKRRTSSLLKEFRKLTKAIPDGGIVVNAEWEIQAFNPVASRMFALKKSDRKGQRIDNLVRSPEFVQYLRDGDFIRPVVVVSPVDNQSRLSVQTFPYGDGQYLMIIKDVTEQFRLEKMRRDFVANASHELRSPLTVIIGYLDSLAEEVSGTDLAQPLSVMQQQAIRMQNLVRDLLQLSRLENRNGDVEEEWVDMASLIGIARKDCQARLENSELVSFDCEQNWYVRGVSPDLQSVVNNLLDNAIKYTLPEGKIELRWSADESGGELSVKDEGIGIADEDIPRLTERFFRVDAGRSREQGGTGLGLAIVKHVLQRHGATLEVESRLGAGSLFVCRFPASRLRHGRGPDPAWHESRTRNQSDT